MPDHIDHIATLADAEHKYFDDEAPAEAAGLGALVFWLVGLLALVVLPIATRDGRRDLGWFQEPATWPAVVLVVALVGGIWLPRRLWSLRGQPGFIARALTAFDGMGRVLAYCGSFLLFLLSVAWVGFTLSTLIYMQVLYRMSGLRGGRWPWIALAVSLVILLAFRGGLGIWFPLPRVIDYLPDWVGNRFGEYL